MFHHKNSVNSYIENIHIGVFLVFSVSLSILVYINMQFFFRPIENIWGFTRETFIEITTYTESKEIRRIRNVDIGYAEHARASTTDDVECFSVYQGDSLVILLLYTS